MNDPAHDCGAVRDDLGELALGLLPGRDRSEAIDHLQTCDACRTHLAQLTRVADALLELAPAAEPPVGFEERATRTFREPAPTRQSAGARSTGVGSRWRRQVRGRPRLLWAAAVAAAAVVASLGFVAGALLPRGGPTPSPPSGANLSSYALTSNGQALGRVYLAPGSRSWIVMEIDSGGPSGVVRCAVTLAGGSQETIGWFFLRHGHGLWSAALGAPASRVRSVEVYSGTGAVMAAARVD